MAPTFAGADAVHSDLGSFWSPYCEKDFALLLL